MRRAGQLLFVVAYLLWIVSFLLIRDTAWFGGVPGQAIQYDYLATRTVLTGRFLGGSTEPVGPPFLLYYLIGVYSMFGRNYAVLRLLGSLWAALLAFLTYRLGKRLWGDWAGVISGSCVALTGPIFLYELTMPGTTLYLCFWVWAIDAYCEGLQTEKPVPLLLSGIGMAMTIMGRPSLGLAGVAMGAYLLLRPGPFLRRVYKSAFLLGGFVMIMIPASWVQFTHWGSTVPTLSYGYAMHLGYHDESDGRQGSDRFQDTTVEAMDFSSYRLEASRRVGRDLSHAEASQFWAHEALAWIAANPGRAATLTLQRMVLFWEPHEFPIDANYHFYRRAGLIPLPVLPFGILLALGLPVMLVGRRSPTLTALRLVTLGFMFGVAVTIVNSRYRLPLLPVMAACAGPGVMQAIEWWRERSVRTRTLAVAVSCAAVALVAWPSPYQGIQWMALDYGMAGNILANQGRYAESIPWVERCLEINPGQPYAWAFLGEMHQKMGDLDKAVAAYERMLKWEDQSFSQISPRMYTRLAELYSMQERYGEAANAAERAIQVNRFYRPAYTLLAQVLRDSGDADRAASVERDLQSLP